MAHLVMADAATHRTIADVRRRLPSYAADGIALDRGEARARLAGRLRALRRARIRDAVAGHMPRLVIRTIAVRRNAVAGARAGDGARLTGCGAEGFPPRGRGAFRGVAGPVRLRGTRAGSRLAEDGGEGLPGERGLTRCLSETGDRGEEKGTNGDAGFLHHSSFLVVPRSYLMCAGFQVLPRRIDRPVGGAGRTA